MFANSGLVMVSSHKRIRLKHLKIFKFQDYSCLFTEILHNESISLPVTMLLQLKFPCVSWAYSPLILKAYTINQSYSIDNLNPTENLKPFKRKNYQISN